MHLWFTYEDGTERFVAGSDLSLPRVAELKEKLQAKADKKIVGHRLRWHANIGKYLCPRIPTR